MAKLLIPAIFIVLFTLAAGRSYCRRRTYISRWGKPHVTTAPSTVPKTSEDTFSSTANHLSRRCCFLSVRISSARPR